MIHVTIFIRKSSTDFLKLFWLQQVPSPKTWKHKTSPVIEREKRLAFLEDDKFFLK